VRKEQPRRSGRGTTTPARRTRVEEVPTEPLTPDQLDALQRWGSGLQSEGGTEELRAAGRAITLLIEELARVQREHWHERVGVASKLEVEPARSPASGSFRDHARVPLHPQPV